MKAIELFEENIKEVILSHIERQEEALHYFIPTRTCVFVGYGNTVEENVLAENGVFNIDIGNEGGAIVSEKDSFAFASFSKDVNNTFNQAFATSFAEYLRGKGLDIRLEGNDFLVDGVYKVASFSSRRYGDLLFSAFHISYEVNLDLIKAICKKEMRKIPKGLKEYGVTKEEISGFFFENYKKALIKGE